MNQGDHPRVEAGTEEVSRQLIQIYLDHRSNRTRHPRKSKIVSDAQRLDSACQPFEIAPKIPIAPQKI